MAWQGEEASWEEEEASKGGLKGSLGGKDGKGKGKGAWGMKGKAMSKDAMMWMMGKAGMDMGWSQPAETFIPGLEESIREALSSVEGAADQVTDDVVWKVYKNFSKTAEQYSKDERVTQRGTPILARAVIEEFVEAAMSPLANSGKEVLQEANLAGPLCLAALYYMKQAKLFYRTLAPMLQRYTEDALFRFREEQRVQTVMWAALEMSGLDASYHKKAYKYLMAAYDHAHVNAPYGTNGAESPELGFLQDFVYAFMNDFVGRGWDVLENGVGTRDDQVIFVTALFQVLTHPEKACYPNDLSIGIAPESLPPANWPFIAEASTTIWAEMDMKALQPKKQQRGGGGGGFMQQMQVGAPGLAAPQMQYNAGGGW